MSRVPRLAFLPGSSGHGSFWAPIRDRIEGVDSFALDWPGLGGVPAQAGISSFEDLVQFTIQSLNGQPSVLVGQSMGGFVAMRVAIERPDLVSHLVLSVTSAGVDRVAIGLPDWRLPADDSSAWVTGPQPFLEARIPEVSAPTLLLWASDDEISPLPLGQRIADLLPNRELVVYQSASHWFVLDHAEDVAARIAAHIEVPGG